MLNILSHNSWKILVCPYCKKSLKRAYSGAICDYCRIKYKFTNNGSLDLRLKRGKKYKLEFEVSPFHDNEENIDFNPLLENPKPEIDLATFKELLRLPRDLMSHFPKAKGKNSIMLDLGCGDAVHKETCKYTGFEYLGLDYASKNAAILGDIHALPFRDNCFDFVLSLAVLQYSRYPFIMMKEAYRVLKPHGTFIGSVAFLEPFHKTFYHHTHLGILNSLKYAGFKIKSICPSKDWSALVALAHMGLFPKMPRLLAKFIIFPLIMIHKLWWRIGGLINPKATETTRILDMTGSFVFIATK